jgi:hypothetical protein
METVDIKIRDLTPSDYPSCEEPLSPNVSACRLGPRTVNSLHAGYRVECDTSGLGDLLAMPVIGFSQRRL